MVERRLDEDDPNWGLANHGRVFDPRRRSRVKVNETKSDGIDEYSRSEALARHRADMRAVFIRLGRPVPPEFAEAQPKDVPDEWRDDWTEYSHMWFSLYVVPTWERPRRHHSGIMWA